MKNYLQRLIRSAKNEEVEIYGFIGKWMGKDVGTAKSRFVELICGLCNLDEKNFPTLSDFDEEKAKFASKTSDGRELRFALQFGDFFEYSDEITIGEGELETNYVYRSKTNTAELQSTTITRGGLELHNYYCKYFCDRSVKFAGGYSLYTSFGEPNCHGKDKTEVKVLMNREAIEDYLLSLTLPLDVVDIYFRLREMYDIDITQAEKVSVILQKKVGDKNKKIGYIIFQNGKLKELGISASDENVKISVEYCCDVNKFKTTISYIGDADVKVEQDKANEIIRDLKARLDLKV